MTLTDTAVVVPPEPSPPAETRRRNAEGRLYLSAAGISLLAMAVMTRLWRIVWSVPFNYGGDATSSAMYFKTVLDTGWYETQPDLGAPYGQHLHDFPFSDELQPMMIKVFGLFTHSWPVVFNAYYVVGFPLAALSAVWFFRRCGLSGAMTVVLAVLFAVAPYHFYRAAAGHYFLAQYFAIPLGLEVVLTAIRGEPLWGRRMFRGRAQGWHPAVRGTLAAVTGRGALTALSVTLVTLDGAYYGVFTAVLLAPAALLALLRTHHWRRFWGVIVSGAVLLAVFVAAMLPDILYERANGSDAAAFVRHHSDAEVYALKFMSLILPAPGYPIPALAQLRLHYDTRYQVQGEGASLGLIASVGFLLLLAAVFVVVLANRRAVVTDPVRLRRQQTFHHLSALTWIAFLVSTIGGLSTFFSFLTPAIRGWNRMSIIIALLALAGLGLAVEALADRWRRRTVARSPGGQSPGGPTPGSKAAGRRFAVPVVALLILVVGIADQSSTKAIPVYNNPKYVSDDVFVKSLQAQLPAGSMIFQTPYIAFPEGGHLGYGSDTDQIKPFLHSTTLRWSGGGIKGRPQTLWSKTVSTEPAATMTRDLAIVGFAGIVVDRNLTKDGGKAIEAALAPYTGAPVLISPDHRLSYLSLDRSSALVTAQLSVAQRAALAAAIVHADGR